MSGILMMIIAIVVLVEHIFFMALSPEQMGH